MAMAGLGRPSEIWHSPLHYYLTLRREYLAAIAPESDEDDVESSVDIGSGVTMETLKQTREGEFSGE